MSQEILSWTDRVALAERFAPYLVLFPEDQSLARPGLTSGKLGDYHPRGVGPLLERSQLATGLIQPRQSATLDALSQCKDPDAQLLILGRALPNPEFAWRTYFELLDNQDEHGRSTRDRFPVTTYARVQTRAEAHAQSTDANRLGEAPPNLAIELGAPFFSPTNQKDDDLAIQYWFCFYYDDWANQHEGDWEGISIFLRRVGDDYASVGASYYAHETGLRRRWGDIERIDDHHPLVYVAAGSHASYFQYIDVGYMTTIQNYILPIVGLKLNIGLKSSHFDIVPSCQVFEPIQPRVETLPDPIGPDDKTAPAWKSEHWLAYPGKWGVNVLGRLGFGGPRGPRCKGLKWCNPFVWMERHCTPDFLVY